MEGLWLLWLCLVSLGILLIWYFIGCIVIFYLDSKYYDGALVDWVDRTPANGAIITVLMFPFVVRLHNKNIKNWRITK